MNNLNKLYSKYDHILTGIFCGLVIPFVGYAILLTIYDYLDDKEILNSAGMAANFRERTIGLIAIVLNVLPLQYFNKINWLNAMRGIVFPTLLLVGLWMYLYGYELLNF
ncbi:MAG: hypothetical protein ABI851_12315 [Saprospiraceae bacterium]